MKNVRLVFSGEWILKHRADIVMPVSGVCAFLYQTYGEKVSVLHETFSIAELRVDGTDIEKLKASVYAYLKETYSDFAESLLEVGEAHFDTESEQQSSKDAAAATKSKAAQDLPFGLLDELQTEDPEYAASSDVKTETDVEKVLKEIDAEISGAEFKALAREIALLAPAVIKNNTRGIFFSQRYLFSVNDGCGLDKYLPLLAKLISASNLRSMDNRIMYCKLTMPKPNSEDPLELTLRDVSRAGKNNIVCIDISDYMNQINSVEFKSFLIQLNRPENECVFVFRIPFVDKEVMDNIGKALNDVMFIREISLPPYTNEEIGAIAARELNKYGFTIEEKAWSGFFQRIREESGDGRFYGYDSICKVVKELLYQKQLDNVKTQKNSFVISSYDTDKLCSSGFSDGLSGMETLDKLVGLENVKNRVLEIISQIELARKTPNMETPCLHMRFVGNPGTGKTTVARIIGKILKEKGILRIGEFHEHAGRDFCGRYIGETAPKTMSICRAAYGSVLFIDEAYSLYRGDDNDRDFGREALDTLIAEMENHRKDLVVIMAGYTDEMERLMKGNAGLLSRMPYTLEFPNFTKDQLYRIFVSMSEGKLLCEEEMLVTAENYFLGLDDELVNSKEFSNARYVRNLYERVCAKAAMRCQLDGKEDIVLTKEDFERAVSDKDFIGKRKKNRIGFGQ